MNQKGDEKDSELFAQLRTKADTFLCNPRLIEIGQEVLDKQLQREVINNPRAFLKDRGMSVPEGLNVTFFTRPSSSRPTPDWTPFIVEFTNCHTVWVRECHGSPRKCEYRKEQICFGWRVYPNPVQPGPFG